MELTIMAPQSTGPTSSSSSPETSREVPDAGLRRPLVIADDARWASHFKETLDRMGVQAHTARTIADAIGAAASGPPHLLVLTMPARDAPPRLKLAAAPMAR